MLCQIIMANWDYNTKFFHSFSGMLLVSELRGMVGFFLLVAIERTLRRGNIEWPSTKLVNMILIAAHCCSLLNIRIRMPCMLMFLSLDITAKH